MPLNSISGGFLSSSAVASSLVLLIGGFRAILVIGLAFKMPAD